MDVVKFDRSGRVQKGEAEQGNCIYLIQLDTGQNNCDWTDD